MWKIEFKQQNYRATILSDSPPPPPQLIKMPLCHHVVFRTREISSFLEILAKLRATALIFFSQWLFQHSLWRISFSNAGAIFSCASYKMCFLIFDTICLAVGLLSFSGKELIHLYPGSLSFLDQTQLGAHPSKNQPKTL